MGTIRLTVAQAVVRFLANQYSERDGRRAAADPGVLRDLRARQRGGRRAGAAAGGQPPGQADLPYYLARNEQGMVHAALGYARTRNRLQAMACTASIGPGSTNMLTGAALATTNRHPGAAAAQRHLRHAGRQPGAAGAGAAHRLRHLGQRRVPPAVAVLRPGVAPRAAARRPARRDARAHRPGRDRCGHDRAAAGRAGRGARLARGAVRQAGLARRPARCPTRPRSPARSR